MSSSKSFFPLELLNSIAKSTEEAEISISYRIRAGPDADELASLWAIDKLFQCNISGVRGKSGVSHITR
jgi:hypothetical protein